MIWKVIRLTANVTGREICGFYVEEDLMHWLTDLANDVWDSPPLKKNTSKELRIKFIIIQIRDRECSTEELFLRYQCSMLIHLHLFTELLRKDYFLLIRIWCSLCFMGLISSAWWRPYECHVLQQNHFGENYSVKLKCTDNFCLLQKSVGLNVEEDLNDWLTDWLIDWLIR